MEELRENLENRAIELKKVIREKENVLKFARPGILNVHAFNENVNFYYKETPDAKERRYLRTSEKDLVRELCQKDYDQRVLSSAQEELKRLEKLLKYYDKSTYEEIFETINIHRQPYINPVRLSDKEFVKQWESFTYTGKEFTEDMPEYYTDKGERVRSKSEILIANALERRKIPYRYEAPLFLDGYGKVYPDFTILDMKTRREWYWEHMGLMDDPVYLEYAIKKIETYEKNQIFPGKNLILTYETRKSPFNQKIVKALIETYLQ